MVFVTVYKMEPPLNLDMMMQCGVARQLKINVYKKDHIHIIMLYAMEQH